MKADLKNFCYPAVYSIDDKNNINISFPDLSEAYTFAENRNYKELYKNVREVLELTITGRIEDKEEIPEPSNLEDIKLKKGEQIVLVNVSVSDKVVRVEKTLTIPENLNKMALRYKINFSEVLAKALQEEIQKYV